MDSLLVRGRVLSGEICGVPQFRHNSQVPKEHPGVIIPCHLPSLTPQSLESEMSSHEALTQAVVGTGRKLVQAGHFAALAMWLPECSS